MVAPALGWLCLRMALRLGAVPSVGATATKFVVGSGVGFSAGDDLDPHMVVTP